eukprot:scaffold158069_cov15-Tisochrysis_lutea.AAC.1
MHFDWRPCKHLCNPPSNSLTSCSTSSGVRFSPTFCSRVSSTSFKRLARGAEAGLTDDTLFWCACRTPAVEVGLGFGAGAKPLTWPC